MRKRILRSNMKTVFAATAGALSGSLVLLALLIAMWGVEHLLWRETVFALSCNTLFCGLAWWPFSKIKPAANPRFDALAGGLFAIFGWFALAIALVKRVDSVQDGSRLHMLGKTAYLLPALAFFVLPQLRVIPTMLERPKLSLSKEANLASADAPNVLLVVVDTLRADVILNPEVLTPNLDALRERGTWAEYAVAPCDQTLPSHLVILTGFDIEKIGMRGNLSRWPSTEMLADAKCMPVAERFKLAGYNTAAVSTNMLLSSVNEEAGHQGFDDGFDTWHGINYATPFVDLLDTIVKHTLMGQLLPSRAITFPFNRLLFPNDIKHYLPHLQEGQRTTDSAIDYMSKLQDDSRPYFMLAQYLDPHSPYIAPNPVRGSFARSDQRPVGFGPAPEDEYFMRVKLRGYCREGQQPDDFMPLSDYLHDLYREEVVYFDQQLGHLLAQVEQGERETIVVFVSDHGEGFGLHRNVEHGDSLYNEEIFVPFIIAGPGVPSANQLDFAPDLIDATYTMLDLAKLSTANVDGQSVLSDSYEVRPALSFMTNHVSIIHGAYKFHGRLVYETDDQPYQLTPLSLYNLQKDPLEANDILAQHPQVVNEIEEIISSRMQKDLFPFINERELTDQQANQLGSLGYTE